MNKKVLFVDDDANILSAYKRQLGRKFDVDTVQGAEEGLARVAEHGPFAVIVSDLRMPKMDGIQFLSKIKEVSPDTVRVMLTGYADLQTAINAVNEGNIFRFLTKPCDTDFLTRALDAGVEQYRLIMSEKELLEKTLVLTESLKIEKQNLQEKNVQLTKLEKLKTDLFNMLIHDLKGPLSEMVTNLEILSHTSSEENLEYVEYAKTGCNTLHKMVANLLDIAQLEEGKIKLAYEEIDPEELVNEALAGLFGLIKMKELEFTTTPPSAQENRLIWGDRMMLNRILQNLLSNAIAHSPPYETIEVGFDFSGSGAIEFFVKDQGPGIDKEHKDTIFEKFVQVEKKRSGRTYTAGLGLTFCKMAVEAHGGNIGVENQDPKGSRFYFQLPLGKA